MERIEKHKAFLKQTISSIEGESIAELDFDLLKSTLADMVAVLDEFQLAQNEKEILREDLIQRLSGMEKAIAVARKSRDSLETALLAIEELPRLDSRQLLMRYRKTRAKFRDTFPTSFMLQPRVSNISGGNKLSDYK